MEFAHRVALVVGGSYGIGGAISQELAERGATVVVNSRARTEPPVLVNQLAARGLPVTWTPADMNDPDEMERLVNEVVATHGRLDVLVVSGGPAGAKAELFAETTAAQSATTVNSMFLSRLNCLHPAIGPMAAQGYGKVVFVTTDAGRVPTPSESVVGAAAAALMYFTRAAGRELARKGIRVNCVSTTLTTQTPVYDRYHGQTDSVLAKAFAKIEAATPFGLNTPTDIAKLCAFLAGPESDQISGATISVNGGLSFP